MNIPDAKPHDIRTVAIIGAGQMGSGIAQVMATAGIAVSLFDVRREALDKGIAAIGRSLDKLVQKQKLSAEAAAKARGLITTGSDPTQCGAVDLAIEAASESEPVKKAIFASLCPALPPETLVATNTSSLSITHLATMTDRPDRFIGMHFMNPVPLMGLVELIRGIATSEPTFAAVRDLVARLGKTAVGSADYPAFIVNRVLLPMINEAVYALFEGVGTVADIDTALKLGANHPMGPLQLADLIGLDTCLAIMQVLHQGLGDSKYRPCPLLIKLVEAGWLGRKTNRGFYDYTQPEPQPAYQALMRS